MAFKKIRGIETEEIFETRVTDGTGRILAKWKVLKQDYHKVIRILNEKFNLNIKVKKIDKDADLEWALK